MMLVTDWKYVALLIVADKDAGNMLAHICASEPDDPDAEMGTFHDGQRVALASNPENPCGYYAEVTCKESVHNVIQALRSGAPYEDSRLDFLKTPQRGLTPELWDMAGEVFKVVDSYQYIQDNGEKTANHNAMEDLIDGGGYVVFN